MKVAGEKGCPGERLVTEESGFTLPEMLITMVIMLIVLFALYNIFDMSVRVFRFGSDETEAVENARLGLEKMEREIRAAYPVNGATAPKYLFFTANGVRTSPPTLSGLPGNRQITFGNERNKLNSNQGNDKIDCNPANVSQSNSAYTPCEYITYRLSNQNGPSGATRTLLRNDEVNGSDPSTGGEPVVEYVNGASGLEFTYLRSVDPDVLASNESEINVVRIKLDILVEGGAQDGTQTLTTDVDLRNRGG